MKPALSILLPILFVATFLMAGCRDTFPQSKNLQGPLSIQLNSAWLYDQKTDIPLLRTRFTYIGGDPNKNYRITAFLSERGQRIQSDYFWQVGIPSQQNIADNGIPMMWEFRDFPRQASDLTMTLVFTPLAGTDAPISLTYSLPSPDRLKSNAGEIQ
jgi:hypothetical protein